jgi:hypothetical protein
MESMVDRAATPRRCARWREEDGRVLVLRDQPAVRGPNNLKAWIRWAWQPKKIRLDELGGFVWRRLDGATPLAEIVAEFREEFQDRSDDIEGRLIDFVAALAKLGLVDPSPTESP